VERELSEETKNDLMEFQQLQQQIQLLQMQRQQTLAQIAEVDKAREEVEKNTGAGQLYRFVGSIIVPKKKDELLKELADERESLDVRVNAFKKQEDKHREKYDALRKKLEQKLSGTQPAQSQPQLRGAKPRDKTLGEGATVA
jgi:prefoldin beta subunit